MISNTVSLELLEVGEADVALLQGGQGGGHVQLGVASQPCQPDRLDHGYGPIEFILKPPSDRLSLV